MLAHERPDVGSTLTNDVRVEPEWHLKDLCDRHQSEQLLLYGLAFFSSSGHSNEVTRTSIFFCDRIAGGRFVGAVRELDLHGIARLYILYISPTRTHHSPMVVLRDEHIDTHLCIQVRNDFLNSLGSSIHTIYSTFERNHITSRSIFRERNTNTTKFISKLPQNFSSARHKVNVMLDRHIDGHL